MQIFVHRWRFGNSIGKLIPLLLNKFSIVDVLFGFDCIEYLIDFNILL